MHGWKNLSCSVIDSCSKTYERYRLIRRLYILNEVKFHVKYQFVLCRIEVRGQVPITMVKKKGEKLNLIVSVPCVDCVCLYVCVSVCVVGGGGEGKTLDIYTGFSLMPGIVQEYNHASGSPVG